MSSIIHPYRIGDVAFLPSPAVEIESATGLLLAFCLGRIGATDSGGSREAAAARMKAAIQKVNIVKAW